MQADEQVALGGTVAPAVPERDQRVGRAGHPDADAPPLELVPKQQAHLEGDVLLPNASRKVRARVPRVDAAMPRIDRDDVPGPETVGQAGGVGSRAAGQRRGPAPQLLQPGPARIPPIAVAQVVGNDLGDELIRQEERVGGERGGGGERLKLIAELVERRADEESERLAGDGDLRPSALHLDQAVERGRQRARRHHRRAEPVSPDGDPSLAAERGHRELARERPGGAPAGRRRRAQRAPAITGGPERRPRGPSRARRPAASGLRACRAASCRGRAPRPAWRALAGSRARAAPA